MSSSPLYPSVLLGRDIRVLRIEPGSQDSTLQCSLLETSLKDASPYYALSYVWGDSKDCKPIECNNHPMEVTTNLHSVLHEYRRRTVPMHLWVDALCINQSSNEEKSSQVRMMQDIYKKADKVIIWLGNMYESDEIAVEALKIINHPWARYNGRLLFTGQDAAAYDLWLVENLSDNSIRAVSSFLQRPWFQRIWIVQELLSARSVDVWCGVFTLESDTILSGAARLISLHNVNMLLQLAMANEPGDSRLRITCAGRLEALRQTMKDTRLGIHELLMITRCFKSTEPRDKMFALVGLAHDIDEDFVNYSMDFSSVITNLSKRFLNGQIESTDCPLDILSCIIKPSVDDSTPSWAVDWTVLSESLFTPLILGYPSEFPIIRHSPIVHFTGDKILHVKGIMVDQVRQMVESPACMQRLVSSKELLNRKAIFETRDWHVRCRQLVEQLPGFPTGEPKDEAFWRTLMCNRKSVGSTDPPEDGTSYYAWTKLLDGQVALLEVESQIELMRRVGKTSFFVLAAFLFAYFSSMWKRWWWLLTLAFILVYNTLRHLWSVYQGPYLGRMRNNYFQNQAENQATQREFEASFSQWSQGRKFCITENGYMGWVPVAAETNDRIVLFHGCRIPFVLRSYEDGNKIIGDCYIHGFMEGFPIPITGTEATYRIY